MLLRYPRRTARVQREYDHLGTPEHPQTPALAGILAARLEHLPAGLVSVPVRGRAAARDQRLPQRHEQRRQTPQTVGDGALGKIQPMRSQIRQQPVRGPVQQILVDQHRHPYRDAQDALRNQPRHSRRRAQRRGRHALAAAAVAPALDHPPIGAHLDLQLLGVLTAVRAILVATCGAAAPVRVNVVCFDLHRQVWVLAPAMAWCPGLLTAPPRWRRCGGLSTAGAYGSLLAAAATRPPFPQPLAQFLELRTRRFQFVFQPLLSLYRLAVHGHGSGDREAGIARDAQARERIEKEDRDVAVQAAGEGSWRLRLRLAALDRIQGVFA